VKTDRRDALMLARLARAGGLVSVTVPDERDEALRDLSRARSDAVRARLKARQQLKAMLLRHGHRYNGKSSWTLAHERYLAEVKFVHPAQNIAFAEYRSSVRDAHERVERFSNALRSELESWRMRPVVEALMSLRGIDVVAAITIVAELGDMRRFTHPRELMAFLGLVPSEHSSGSSRRLGAITKCGNGYARRVLVEAAWNYRFPAGVSRANPPAEAAEVGSRHCLAGAAAPEQALPPTTRPEATEEQSLCRHRTRAHRFCLGHRSPDRADRLKHNLLQPSAFRGITL